MLSPAQQAARKEITGSFLPALMAGYQHEIYNKWLELIGDPSWELDDLSDNWAVQWGSHGEPFVLNWHERKTKHALTRRGEVIAHPHKLYVSCTLDAFREFDSTVLDAKVCDGHNPLDKILAFYTPQLICQRACLQCDRAALLLVHGAAEAHEYPIEIDADYERVMWQRVDQFKWCVDNFVEPVVFPRVVPPEQWRTIDLDADSAQFNWAADMKALLQKWDNHYDSAMTHKEATEDIKKLLPEDVGKLSFGSLLIKRNRANAVSIKRAKQ